MRINKWFGKLNIKLEIRYKKRYHHSMEYLSKKMMKYSLMYGTGVSEIKWDIKKRWEFWK